MVGRRVQFSVQSITDKMSVLTKISASLAFCFFLAACADDKKENPDVVRVGDAVPEFSVTMNDGRAISAASLKGRVAVIVFFNTACGDCRNYLPRVQRLYERVRGGGVAELRDVEFVPISRAQPETEVEAYWREQRFSLPYSAQTDRKVYERFALMRIPRTYVIDAKGVISAAFDDADAPDENTLEAALIQAAGKS